MLCSAQQQKEAADEGKSDANTSDSVKPSEGGAEQPTLHAADLRKCILANNTRRRFVKFFYCFTGG